MRSATAKGEADYLLQNGANSKILAEGVGLLNPSAQKIINDLGLDYGAKSPALNQYIDKYVLKDSKSPTNCKIVSSTLEDIKRGNRAPSGLISQERIALRKFFDEEQDDLQKGLSHEIIDNVLQENFFKLLRENTGIHISDYSRPDGQPSSIPDDLIKKIRPTLATDKQKMEFDGAVSNLRPLMNKLDQLEVTLKTETSPIARISTNTLTGSSATAYNSGMRHLKYMLDRGPARGDKLFSQLTSAEKYHTVQAALVVLGITLKSETGMDASSLRNFDPESAADFISTARQDRELFMNTQSCIKAASLNPKTGESNIKRLFSLVTESLNGIGDKTFKNSIEDFYLNKKRDPYILSRLITDINTYSLALNSRERTEREVEAGQEREVFPYISTAIITDTEDLEDRINLLSDTVLGNIQKIIDGRVDDVIRLNDDVTPEANLSNADLDGKGSWKDRLDEFVNEVGRVSLDDKISERFESSDPFGSQDGQGPDQAPLLSDTRADMIKQVGELHEIFKLVQATNKTALAEHIASKVERVYTSASEALSHYDVNGPEVGFAMDLLHEMRIALISPTQNRVVDGVLDAEPDKLGITGIHRTKASEEAKALNVKISKTDISTFKTLSSNIAEHDYSSLLRDLDAAIVKNSPSKMEEITERLVAFFETPSHLVTEEMVEKFHEDISFVRKALASEGRKNESHLVQKFIKSIDAFRDIHKSSTPEKRMSIALELKSKITDSPSTKRIIKTLREKGKEAGRRRKMYFALGGALIVAILAAVAAIIMKIFSAQAADTQVETTPETSSDVDIQSDNNDANSLDNSNTSTNPYGGLDRSTQDGMHGTASDSSSLSDTTTFADRTVTPDPTFQTITDPNTALYDSIATGSFAALGVGLAVAGGTIAGLIASRVSENKKFQELAEEIRLNEGIDLTAEELAFLLLLAGTDIGTEVTRDNIQDAMIVYSNFADSQDFYTFRSFADKLPLVHKPHGDFRAISQSLNTFANPYLATPKSSRVELHPGMATFPNLQKHAEDMGKLSSKINNILGPDIAKFDNPDMVKEAVYSLPLILLYDDLRENMLYTIQSPKEHKAPSEGVASLMRIMQEISSGQARTDDLQARISSLVSKFPSSQREKVSVLVSIFSSIGTRSIDPKKSHHAISGQISAARDAAEQLGAQDHFISRVDQESARSIAAIYSAVNMSDQIDRLNTARGMLHTSQTMGYLATINPSLLVNNSKARMEVGEILHEHGIIPAPSPEEAASQFVRLGSENAPAFRSVANALLATILALETPGIEPQSTHETNAIARRILMRLDSTDGRGYDLFENLCSFSQTFALPGNLEGPASRIFAEDLPATRSMNSRATIEASAHMDQLITNLDSLRGAIDGSVNRGDERFDLATVSLEVAKTLKEINSLNLPVLPGSKWTEVCTKISVMYDDIKLMLEYEHLSAEDKMSLEALTLDLALVAEDERSLMGHKNSPDPSRRKLLHDIVPAFRQGALDLDARYYQSYENQTELRFRTFLGENFTELVDSLQGIPEVESLVEVLLTSIASSHIWPDDTFQLAIRLKETLTGLLLPREEGGAPDANALRALKILSPLVDLAQDSTLANIEKQKAQRKSAEIPESKTVTTSKLENVESGHRKGLISRKSSTVEAIKFATKNLHSNARPLFLRPNPSASDIESAALVDKFHACANRAKSIAKDSGILEKFGAQAGTKVWREQFRGLQGPENYEAFLAENNPDMERGEIENTFPSFEEAKGIVSSLNAIDAELHTMSERISQNETASELISSGSRMICGEAARRLIGDGQHLNPSIMVLGASMGEIEEIARAAKLEHERLPSTPQPSSTELEAGENTKSQSEGRGSIPTRISAGSDMYSWKQGSSIGEDFGEDRGGGQSSKLFKDLNEKSQSQSQERSQGQAATKSAVSMMPVRSETSQSPGIA